jgi:hypothetical protein
VQWFLRKNAKVQNFLFIFFFAIFAPLREDIFARYRLIPDFVITLTAARFNLTIHTDFEY